MYQQPNRYIKILKDIWPFIYRAINSTLYFVFNVIRYIFQEGMKMITNKYD